MELLEGTMAGVSKPDTVSPKQQRIAELARRMPGKALHALSHHLDLDWMREAYRRTRKSGAVGVDGQGAAEFARNLDQNLTALLDAAKAGTYAAPPVRRVHIPKGDGTKTRPIGIPTFGDKVLQRAVAMAIEPIYEEDFLDFSYGFRPGRSAHDALRAVWQGAWDLGGGWVLEVDIKSFFDTLDHARLRELLRQRVTDGVLVRLVGKWLNAGVLEGGVLSHAEAGTPQGGVISPLLANIYLHEVLDTWWVSEVLPRLRGRATLVRYADDFVIVFAREDDAHRVQDVLPKRFGKYGLTLHPDKTRLVPFRRPPGGPRPPGSAGVEPPGSFDFLGFNHHWERSLRGRWVPKQTTAKSRFSRACRAITQWCRGARHRPIGEQARMLGLKLKGHYQYYGITGNSKALARFFRRVRYEWWKWLGRRSQRARLPWPAYHRLLERFPLPPPIAVHSRLRRTAKP